MEVGTDGDRDQAKGDLGHRLEARHRGVGEEVEARVPDRRGEARAREVAQVRRVAHAVRRDVPLAREQQRERLAVFACSRRSFLPV